LSQVILYDVAAVAALIRTLKPAEAPKKVPPKSPEAAGGRNNYLTSVAGSLRNRGLDPDAVEAALLAINAQLEDPLGDDEVRTIARSSRKFKTPDRVYNHTDTGNAERFADASPDLKYCPQRDKWYWWDGRTWNEDEKGTRATQRAISLARSLYEDAAEIPDADLKKATKAWARKSESAARLASTVQVARSMDSVRVGLTDFDADPWILNVQNGMLDLRTGQLLPHDPARLCTKMARAPFVEGARSAVFDAYLEHATEGNTELAGFLQRALGYSLTGDTSGQCLFMVIGVGGTGKTTLIEALKDLLGTYASTARAETLLERRNDEGPRNDLAAMNGMRLIGVSEIKKGKTLDHGVIKSLAGSDKISARFLYGEPFEFRPIAKLWLAANDAPRVDVEDTGMWRRIIRVPFNRVVPEAQRDADLPAKLGQADTLSAILAWALQGCLDWQARGKGKAGLAEPACIRQATADYRKDLNPLNDFVSDSCIVDPTAWVSGHDLRSAYARWCRESGFRAVGSNAFHSLLVASGFLSESRDGARAYVGLRLAARQRAEPM
jgi:putative DNA primase/helicase